MNNNDLVFLKRKLEKLHDIAVNAEEGYIVTPKGVIWVVANIPLVARPGTYCIQLPSGERIPHITESEMVSIISSM